MWDRPHVLNRLADLLATVALLLAVYAAVHFTVLRPGFAVRAVNVSGTLAHVSGDEIAVLIKRELRGNFFSMDLAALRAAFERLPWVRKASLRRQWPDRLEVTLEEHVPLARWGSAALVNIHGELFEAPYGGNLPVFVGPTDSAKEIAIQYEYFRRSLAAIGKAPALVQVSPRRAWQVRIDGGPTLELGREQVEARLARFIAAYGRTLAKLERRIDYVDLRYANGFAVRIPGLRNERVDPKTRARAARQGRT
jgi:cell division protein FtsQ